MIPRLRSGDLPDPDTLIVRAVLLASEEREIPRAAVDLAARIAERSNAPVHVFSIARVWGTTFGFPNPGLLPSKKEWDRQYDVVRKAVSRLKRKGIEADARVIGTRAAAKRIVNEAKRLNCDAIVMGADPPKHALVRDFSWSQEPYRVKARAGDLPVYLVVEDSPVESAA
ncbi:MAG TPA: universal stress protein [Thermoleophilaceae bacterium]